MPDHDISWAGLPACDIEQGLKANWRSRASNLQMHGLWIFHRFPVTLTKRSTIELA